MKELLQTLIAFPTVTSDLRANGEALEYIDRYLSERGLFVKRFQYGDHESLVATTQQTKSPRIMLAAHLDVVSAPPRLFNLVEKDGKFYGRGVCDMKFAIAAYLQLIDDLRDDLDRYDLGIMITTDEEVGGRHGVKMLLEDAGCRTDVCVLPDGGDDWAIEQASKGILWVFATASGTSAHGSRPWEGENAIEKMLLFLQAMQRELFVEQSNDTTSCNIGTIQGGEAVNKVADVCTADIDIRPINREEQERIINKLNELSVEYDVSLEHRLNDSPINLDLTDPYVVAYIESAENIIGRSLGSVTSNGGSDARYFAKYDIPTLVHYPTGGGRHSDHEWLDVKSFYQFGDLLHDFVVQTERLADHTLTKSLTSAQ